MSFSKQARVLRTSALFDRGWYRERYPDVAAVGLDPILHYLAWGASAGRDPGPDFDTLWYLETNPDVAGEGVNPLYHYIKVGKREGRTPQPLIDGRVIRAWRENVDVAAYSGQDSRLICSPDARSAILRLFKVADPTVAEILELNVAGWTALAQRPHKAADRLTIVVTHNEICNEHGTGVLVNRLFGNVPLVLTVRHASDFNNRDEIGFANIWLGSKPLSDQQLYRLFSFLLAGQQARCVVCVPYSDTDLRVGLRLAEILSAPFALYVMDDSNVIGQGIHDRTMWKAVRAAVLRLAISAEMREAYENKFRQKFFVLPPLVPPSFIGRAQFEEPENGTRGVVVGNIWRQGWLRALVDVIHDCGIELDWFCNVPQPKWLSFEREEIANKGLHYCDPLPEDKLVDHIRQSPFCVLPTGTGDDDPRGSAIARLSLPSRISLVVAACQIPIIVIGDQNTAAARFVRRFGVGVAVPYESQALKSAIQAVLDPSTRKRMYENAARIAGNFSSEGVADWLFRSIDVGQAIDDRFESFLATAPGDIAYHIDRPCPSDIQPDLHDAFRALRRLRERGYDPDFVIDGGASSGVWSRAMAQLFPRARFLLIDPLFSRYNVEADLRLIEAHRNFEIAEVALHDREGEVEMQVSGDIYNSSSFQVRLTGVQEVVKVSAVTLDRLVREVALQGRGVLKIDVQYAEHLVLDGAKDLLRDQIDVVIIEMTLHREHPEAKTFLEICNKMHDLGFDYEDDAGEWRSPINGRLEQKDGLFVRKGANF